MTNQKKWNAATIEMVLINSDTPIPRRVLHTHTPKDMGLNGRVHVRRTSLQEYRYYYPGILDSLLHIDFPHQLHAYLLPSLHAVVLEQWCLQHKLRSYRFRAMPSGKTAAETISRMESAFYTFIRGSQEAGINKLRWISNLDIAPDEAVKRNEPILTRKIVSKMWFLDWTPDRIGTREFVERHGIDIDLDSLQPVKEILVSEM